MAEATLAFNILTKYKDTGADRARRDMDGLNKSSGRLTSSMKTVGKVGAVAVAAGVVIAGKALFDMTKAAMQDEAAQKKLSAALKNNANATAGQVAATEKWITAQGKALGVTDDELRPALGKLVTATKDVGEAQKLAALAMDVSAGSGKSLDAVSTALMKAQNGQVSALSRLGINTKNAAGETITMEQATKRMADTFGGQAAVKANTLQGKMDRLRLIFDETKESIGAKLIPVVTQFADFMLTKVGPALQKAGAWAKDNLLPPLQAVGGFIVNNLVPAVRTLVERALNGARAAFKTVGGAVDDNRKQFGQILTVIKTVYGFVLRNLYPVIGTYLKGAFKVLGVVIGAAIRIIGGLVTAIDKTVKTVRFAAGVFVAFKDTVKRVFGAVKDAVTNATRWVIDKVLWMAEKVLDGAVAAFGWAPKIGDKLKAARDKVADFRKDVNAELDQVKDEGVTVTVKANVKGVTAAVAGFGANLFATGGPVSGGTPGKDSVLGLMMPGEHVLTSDEVKRAGGHRGVYAIRKMLKRGEFAKNGDVPAFAGGGPVFGAGVPNMSGLSGQVGAMRDGAAGVLGKAAKVALLNAANHWLKEQAGKGKLSAAQIARGQSFAQSQVGKPYVWGGVGPGGYDCSGFVSAVLNAAQGKSPYSRRGSTGTMPWAGFSGGKGSFSAGWFTGSPGHMAGNIGGLGIESAGGVGVRTGAAATSVNSFPNIAHYDNGGMLQPGWTMAYNGTGRPEPVGHNLAPQVHFHGCTFVGASEKQMEDVVVKAIDGARRKGRV